MRILARRNGYIGAGGSMLVACAVLTACGGGADERTQATADGTASTQAAVRHASPYSRSGITAITASTDGKSVAVAHSDGRVVLLDATSRSETRQLAAAGNRVAAGLIFSADGHSLVGVDRDSSVQVWDVDTGATRLTLHGHEHPLRSVSASADGTLVATAGEETRVMLWDGDTGRLKRVLTGASDFVNSVSVSADGQLVASGDANARVLVWKVATGQIVSSLRGHTGEVNAVAFSPDGSTLASAGEDGKVIVWQASGGQVATVLASSGAAVRSLAFSSDGQVLAAGNVDGKVTLWNTSSHQRLSESAATAGAVNALAFGVRDRSELLFGDGRSSVLALSVSRQAAK